KYPATRPVQPIPETTATFSRGSLDSTSARAKQFTVVPIPQPGHQMCGMRSVRRKGSTGLTMGSVLITPPLGFLKRYVTPSPVSPRLVKAPDAIHPLPQGGEGIGV